MPLLYIFLLFNVVCADFGNEGLSQGLTVPGHRLDCREKLLGSGQFGMVYGGVQRQYGREMALKDVTIPGHHLDCREKLFGSGQFGTYGGVQRQSGREMAVKGVTIPGHHLDRRLLFFLHRLHIPTHLVLNKVSNKSLAVETLKSEMAILQAVDHQGIIKLESMFETGDKTFVAMEKMDMDGDMLEMILCQAVIFPNHHFDRRMLFFSHRLGHISSHLMLNKGVTVPGQLLDRRLFIFLHRLAHIPTRLMLNKGLTIPGHHLDCREKLFGSGQFGTYGGVQRQYGREMTMKAVANCRFSNKSLAVDTLKSEMAILQTVDHHGIIKSEFMFETEDKTFVAMEKMDMDGDMLEMILCQFLPLLLFRRWPVVILFVALFQFPHSAMAIKPFLLSDNKMREYLAWFRFFDNDKNAELEHKQFKEILWVYGRLPRFDEQHKFERILDVVDPKRKGFVTRTAFMAYLVNEHFGRGKFEQLQQEYKRKTEEIVRDIELNGDRVEHFGKKNCSSNTTEQTTTPTTTNVPTTTLPTTTTTARPQNDEQRPSSSSSVDLFKSFWNLLNAIWLFPVTIFGFVLLLSGDGDIRRRLFNSGVPPTLPEQHQPAVVEQPIAELPAIVEPTVLVPELDDPIQLDGLLVLDEVGQPDDGPVADAPDQPLPPQLRNLPANSPADLSHYVVPFGHQFNGNIV
ncbi:hypothetical protein niasHT_027726 [Heterodera trifolii]|uniref:Protein kinase domain-containing protein n=1 Tax=Heterodera trifolii TaxID=157864 RepID=A0ABD2KBF5_9BILA